MSIPGSRPRNAFRPGTALWTRPTFGSWTAFRSGCTLRPKMYQLNKNLQLYSLLLW